MLALTGATGFVGQATLGAALAVGHHARALARREQAERTGVTWIEGDLSGTDALDRLVDCADAVIHIAGAVNVPTREAFAAANIAGTQAVIEAAQRAGVSRFVHVSSLAAREPNLSDYGWSKAGAEDAVRASGLDWTIVRPPAIYGPRDSDMLELFRMAQRGFALLPPPGRASIIHVEDLARLLLALAHAPGRGETLEPDDGAPLAHCDLALAVGRAVGRNVRAVSAPAAMLRLAALGDRLARGPRARLTPDRAAYLAHPDWTADPAKAPDPALWVPHVALDEGLASTARWYRAEGWL